MKGKLENLTPATLRLTTKGGFRDYAQSDALEVRQKRGDSLANGAWIGAVSGGGFGSGLAIACCSGGECVRIDVRVELLCLLILKSA